jgi:hypothetical protein
MDPTIKTTIEQRLIESGEKERLKVPYVKYSTVASSRVFLNVPRQDV